MIINQNMKKLEKKRLEIEKRYKEGTALQKYRNLDFPHNPLQICEINLKILFNYFHNEMNKKGYEFHVDNVLITYISNYLSSVKGYLNRKKNTIDKRICVDSKKDILSIISKYWKARRNETKLDAVIQIRDKFEHEKIEGISLQMTFGEDNITKYLMLDNYNLLELFRDAYNELATMDKEIKEFVESKIIECNLRDCIMFKLSFSKKYNTGFQMLLFPEPTIEEIREYDDLIDSLANEL